MVTHSSILAWRIPWTEELGGLQSMGSQRVGHDWSDWAHVQTLKNNNEKHSSLSHKYGLGRGDTGWVPYAIFSGRGFPGGSDSKVSACNAGDPGLIPGVGKIPWRRKWKPTPGLLPGKLHGRRSLVGYSPWGHKKLDTTKRLHFFLFSSFGF